MTSLLTQSLPADHFIKLHQFTLTTHRDVYPSIDPSSPALSQKGKTVIVTGASQGIGKAIALAFAKAGVAKIILAARSVEKLEETKREVMRVNDGVEVLVFPTDITSQQSVEKLEDKAKGWCGVPDVLVNAAGLWSSTSTLSESNPEKWWADFEVNLKGTYLLIRSFLRLLGPSYPGTIINVGSWGMLMTAPTGSSYSISKLALARLSEAIPSEYPNVRSMNFHPGMIKTDMADGHLEVLPFCGDTRMSILLFS
jgi:NAD(P)-dependent dehydrogenase (short-subunit alcohol dehydrogenase family)